MRKLKALFLCSCIVLSLFIVAESKAQQINKSSQISNSQTNQHNENDFPKIFRPIGNFFKRILRKKPKSSYCLPPDIRSLELNQVEVISKCSSPELVEGFCSNETQTVKAVVETLSHKDESRLIYEVSGGKIMGEGSKVVWDLSDALPGTYTITVLLEDKECPVCRQPITKEVKVIECPKCKLSFNEPPPMICPAEMEVTSNKQQIKEGEFVTFTANVKGLEGVKFVYNWSISSGEIINGQGTPTLTVKSAPESAEYHLTAAVFVGDNPDTTCRPSSATVRVVKP